ncbi:Rho GTPase activation protein [Gonapodya prolifera JEL478]|uniref:Rho GTPase activation protein n=1 Tax=Gonapodya prolifera (strain JEL478) TaxID=1344416 RepID=A0A139APH0_GONPJ|nr:Rho GTPase activation protein [Gonapodya prolifera JEL478]|eukprot:KXS18385.1 Rho GTPase activation protein [Gonapodya prolifera JEL478]
MAANVARELHVKIQEAKFPSFQSDARNAYCSVYLDDREVFSTPVSASDGESIMFNEEFFLDDVPSSSAQLTFTLFSDTCQASPIGRSASIASSHSRSPASPSSPRSASPSTAGNRRSLRDRPLGALSIPTSLMMTHIVCDENWWVLTPVTEDAGRVSGEVHVKVAYQAPRRGGPKPTDNTAGSRAADIDNQLSLTLPGADSKHVFAVTIEAARGLLPRGDSNLANPYAVLHLLPDPDLTSMQNTNVCKRTTDPQFRQDFLFTVQDIHPYHRLHVALWDYDSKSGLHDEFLGHIFTVSYEAILRRQIDGKQRKQGLAKARAFVKALQQQQVSPSAQDQRSRQHRFVDTKFFSVAFCSFCGGVLFPGKQHLQCGNCKLNAHVDCAKFVGDRCGALGTLRIFTTFSEFRVLALKKYMPLLDILTDRNYTIATTIGRNVSNREEIASAMLRITEHTGKGVDFVRSVVINEIQEAKDVATLFRNNSMATKAVDLYQKQVGGTYLRTVLEGIIMDVVRDEPVCELDPTRVVDSADLATNQATLLTWSKLILDAISSPSAIAAFPEQLQTIYSAAVAEVNVRFPGQPNAKYSAVAGFLFLRLLVPAILGPKLFGLMDEFPTAPVARTLTLLAKVIQTIANMADGFSEKERYMMVLNDFVVQQQSQVKKFLDAVATNGPSTPNVPNGPPRIKIGWTTGLANSGSPRDEELEYATDCARLAELLTSCENRILKESSSSPKDTAAVKKLFRTLHQIRNLATSARELNSDAEKLSSLGSFARLFGNTANLASMAKKIVNGGMGMGTLKNGTRRAKLSSGKLFSDDAPIKTPEGASPSEAKTEDHTRDLVVPPLPAHPSATSDKSSNSIMEINTPPKLPPSTRPATAISSDIIVTKAGTRAGTLTRPPPLEIKSEPKSSTVLDLPGSDQAVPCANCFDPVNEADEFRVAGHNEGCSAGQAGTSIL